MATNDDSIRLVFNGPRDRVSPELLDAQPALAVALAFVETLQVVGAYESATDGAPFRVVLRRLETGSVVHAYAPVAHEAYDTRSAKEAWHTTARRLPLYMESADRSPAPIAKKLRELTKVTRRLPDYVDALAVSREGTISISEIAKRPPRALLRSTETFRAELLRAGGRHPRIQLVPAARTRAVVLEATPDLVRIAGASLYRQADVTATLDRRTDGHFEVVGGTISEIRVADEEVDPVRAFDEWYASAETKWAHVDDIGRELKRGRH